MPARLISVLIAEDNVVNQRVALGLLTRRGHTVTVVGNGREALDALERDAYDLVLMDVQMPVMDGLKATAAIRTRESIRIEAQRLKGAAGNLSAIGLFNAAQILELVGAEARLDAADAAWRLVSMEASQVLDALRRFEARETSASA